MAGVLVDGRHFFGRYFPEKGVFGRLIPTLPRRSDAGLFLFSGGCVFGIVVI